MVVRKEKKHRKFRGRRTYHGQHRKWRGGGSRGGRGKAGMHKHKWSYTVKYEPEHFGKHGFEKPKKEIKTINLSELDELIDKIDKSLISEEDGKIKINLEKIGYDKLLGSGKIKKPIIIQAKYFSKIAEEKVKEVGGRIEKI
jgi:large subunit ribosomal protein L15